MVEEAPKPRKKLSRFTPWVNRLELTDAELPKVVDQKQVVTKTEFKDAGPITKYFDCRVMKSTMPVTKAYAQRKKKDPVFDAFGIGEGQEAIRGNAHITMLHRDNVWHPYYEIKTEEEDLGTKMRARQAERRGQDNEGSEIQELKTAVQTLTNNQREANEARADEAKGVQKKRTFDAKALQQKMATAAEAEEKMVLDPKAIKLNDIPKGITQEEIKEAFMAKFGGVDDVYMPMDSQSRIPRHRGFAIVRFNDPEKVNKALQE